MQKNLKLKLEKLSRDQLLDLLEELSNVPNVQKMIKAMVSQYTIIEKLAEQFG